MKTYSHTSSVIPDAAFRLFERIPLLSRRRKYVKAGGTSVYRLALSTGPTFLASRGFRRGRAVGSPKFYYSQIIFSRDHGSESLIFHARRCNIECVGHTLRQKTGGDNLVRTLKRPTANM